MKHITDKPLTDYLEDRNWQKKGLKSLDKLFDEENWNLEPIKDHRRLSRKPKRRLSSILRNRNV